MAVGVVSRSGRPGQDELALLASVVNLAAYAVPDGCGSPEGTSGGLWNEVVGVASCVNALVFFVEVVAPVLLEVAVAV